MFESYSSSANQSAVDKLIQLATGKKGSAPVEEERPAAPEAVEAPTEPVEAAAEQPPASEPAAEAAVEETPSPASEAPVETPVDARAEAPSNAASVIDSLAGGARVAEEPVDDRPFYEPVAEAPLEAASPQSVSESAVESVPEPVAEAAPAEESAPAPVETPPAVEQAPEPVQADEPPVEERPFHEPVAEVKPEPEAAVATPVEEPAAVAPTPEPVSEPVAETPAEVPAEPKAPEREAQTKEEAPVAAAEAEAGKATAAEAAKSNSGEPAREEPGNLAAEPGAGPEPVAEKNSAGKAGQDDPFDLEKFRQRQAERRRARGADIFPSPDETTFLRSRYGGTQRDEVTEEELKTLSRDPMWKTLVQFKGWLPVVTRVLPLLDLAGKRASSGNSEEIKDSVDGLMVSNRDMRTTLQNQTVELKRVEEEITRLREASDKNAFEQNAISEDVRGIQRLMKSAFLYVGILLGLMVVAVGYMAFLVFTYLNHPMH